MNLIELNMNKLSQEVLEIIYTAVDEYNITAEDEAVLKKDVQTILKGNGCVLDSVGYVMFMVALEENLSLKYNNYWQLLTDSELIERNDILTIDMLHLRILELLK